VSKNSEPAYSDGTSARRTVARVTTTPQYLPPRSAQNSSGCAPGPTSSASPRPVATENPVTQSDDTPWLRANGPRPPPTRYPATPTFGDAPAIGASPCGAAAATTAPHRAPAPTVTVRAAASTATASSRRVAIIKPPRSGA
jgi:hypothetical protein